MSFSVIVIEEPDEEPRIYEQRENLASPSGQPEQDQRLPLISSCSTIRSSQHRKNKIKPEPSADFRVIDPRKTIFLDWGFSRNIPARVRRVWKILRSLPHLVVQSVRIWFSQARKSIKRASIVPNRNVNRRFPSEIEPRLLNISIIASVIQRPSSFLRTPLDSFPIAKGNIVYFLSIKQIPIVSSVCHNYSDYNLFQYIIFPNLHRLNMAREVENRINHFAHREYGWQCRRDSNHDDSNQDLGRE